MLVLVIEDNRTLARNIIEFLEAFGHECDYADNGLLGLELAKNPSLNFDVIILDIMLPGKDGIFVCKSLRSLNISTPIIMLTAKDSLEDKLKGFECGADDYLIKPFELPELEARINALKKRNNTIQNILKIADLSINLDLHEVKRNNQTIKLNKACWTILETLMRESPKVISKQTLEHTLWPDSVPDSDVLKSHIYQLRQLLDKPFDKKLIKTIRGTGICIRDNHE